MINTQKDPFLFIAVKALDIAKAMPIMSKNWNIFWIKMDKTPVVCYYYRKQN
jgi:hypothetical protein